MFRMDEAPGGNVIPMARAQVGSAPIHVDLDVHLAYIRDYLGLIEMAGDGTDAWYVTPLGWRVLPTLLAVGSAQLKTLENWDEDEDHDIFMLVQASFNELAKRLG
jgi:hypothetical protein